MTVGIVDTNILVFLLRGYEPAHEWLRQQPEQLAITPIVWMEIMQGSQSKKRQEASLALLDQFEMVPMVQDDLEWSMRQLGRLGAAYTIDMMDYLIASVCIRLEVPIITLNLKHMIPLLGITNVVSPFSGPSSGSL